MKRLIIINLLLIIALNILPKEMKVEAISEQVSEQVNVQVIEQVSSRSLDAKREENASCEIQDADMQVTEISQEGIELIKKSEGFRDKAYRLDGEKYWTIRIWNT